MPCFTRTLNILVNTPSISKIQLSLNRFSEKSHKALIVTPNIRITRFSSLIPVYSSISDDSPDPEPVSKPHSKSTSKLKASPTSMIDEWGEKVEPEPELEYRKAADADCMRNEGEWKEEYGGGRNGSASVPPLAKSDDMAEEGKDERVEELKKFW